MREEAELSIRELRAKRAESTEAFGADGDDAPPPNSREDEPHYEPGSWERRRAPWEEGEIPPQRRIAYNEEEKTAAEPPARLPFDPMRILEALKQRWYLWITPGLILGALGFCWKFWETRSVASMQLMRREAPALFKASDAGSAFSPQQLSEPALLTMMRSAEVLRRTASKTTPPIPILKLASGLKANAEEGTEMVTVVFTGNTTPQAAVDLLNIYAAEVVQYTQEKQTEEVRVWRSYIASKLKNVEADLAQVNAEMAKFPAENRFVNPNKLMEEYLIQLSQLDVRYDLAKIELGAADFRKLQAARDQLDQLRIRYTDLHPQVIAQKATIAALEKQIENNNAGSVAFPAPAKTDGPADPPLRRDSSAYAHRLDGLDPLNSGKGGSGRLTPSQLEELKTLRDNIKLKLDALSEKSVAYELVKNRLQSLETLRSMLAGRLREAQLFEKDALGYFRIFSPASLDRAAKKSQWKKSVVLGFAGALFGMLAVAGFLAVREVLDDRLKTAGDVERVTGLRVLATLGDIDQMTPAAQANWAFRTWTILKGKLDSSGGQGLVCGFISARRGEGRSTWINLLINTANQRGLRVLTVATQRMDEPAMHPHEAPAPAEPVATPVPTPAAAPASAPETISEALVKTTLSPNVLAFPSHVTRQLTDPSSQSVVHIPLPGWVWNLERRKQWQDALEHWQQIENLVLLVELPPASEPESVLLAEKLPQVIWLTESGTPTISETRMHLETLRHGGCNLVGAVLNREPVTFWKRHLSRWLGAIVIASSLGLSSVQAAENPDSTALSTNVTRSFSIGPTSPRAAWQKQLTLGAGDMLNLGLFGETNYNKLEVTIGPDGRISYLQATDVMAAGLTVDQLRQALDQALSKFYQNPRTLISPVSYRSKRYYMLGKIMTKGAFVLDRPLTVLEAIARARGLESGLLDRNAIDIADLQRSFLIRHGQRIALDLEKLFNEGDLSQNIAIEPDDFLYFPSAALNEVYILGEVRTPGVMPFHPGTSVVGAIANRGGFTERAYKRHVLVVRGSLNHPQTYVVNVWGALDARNNDFKLESKDIVFVNHRPFIKAEEVLDYAATAFIQSMVTTWTGVNVGPLIGTPIFPALDKEDR